MRFALLLLWLTILAPAAHAADWLTWRRVGEATLTWGPFTVYHSQLRTPNGRYDGPQQDRALIITYRRDIDREALVEATRDQWQAQGILQQEPRSEAWLRMLQGIWPDVAPGSQLAFVVRGGEGQFWPAPHRPPLPRSARASRRRSAPAFSPSGSIPAPFIPNCVSS